ncbi:MAG: hypothetical protein CMJ64_01645 [Planctomycetaceae bacterium]|nr:hypothetical protein [Planctomycetaceae bacterium]
MTMSERLLEQLRPHYVVDIEEYIYLTRDVTGEQAVVRPDVAVSQADGNWGSPETTAAATLEPVLLTVPMQERFEQHYIAIRRRKRQQVVTIIELLSPWNKAADGYDKYLLKRDSIFGSRVHLLELDLLRGGKRLPTVEPLPVADYYSFLCRTERLPHVEVLAWPMRQALPAVRVPLTNGDSDAALDLQDVFTTVYDRGGYDYALDYDLGELSPSVTDDEAAWIQRVLQERGAG